MQPEPLTHLPFPAGRAGRATRRAAPLWAALAAALTWAAPATAQEDNARRSGPSILLLNGLGVGPGSAGVGLNPLARRLWAAGYDVHVSGRANGLRADVVPDVIIGHSMGGGTALRIAARLVAQGAPEPVVITIDATPAPPCPVRHCFNIHGPNFGWVPGAVNISARALGARPSSHLRLPAEPAVEQYILARVGGLQLTQGPAGDDAVSR